MTKCYVCSGDEKVRKIRELYKCDHKWSEWRRDLNNESYRNCKKCGLIDESRRTPETQI